MKPFHTVAVPHRDILEGRLSLDVYAADLWDLYQGRALSEYRDADTFFRRTYPTRGLQHLVAEVQRRLHGEGGDPVIQLQTPFGGGKTHALISLYHHAASWGARRVVLAGDALGGETPLWAVLEEQLTGTRARLTSRAAPGREALRAVLEPHQPVLILIDELLEYVTKAAGTQVGESTMAAQTMAFMQELTETVASLPRVCLVLTLPSSVLERYDASAERLFQQLQKVVGRVERVLTPVAEDEVAAVIRRRLFDHVDEREAQAIVDAYLDYASREGLLPSPDDGGGYRRRFLDSYPFLPEVIDVLYHRWGSFPGFQRTRGVLRILALVVYHLRQSNHPFITLADFDLTQGDLRRELLKYTGNEYDSIIASDITGSDSGSRKADAEMGAAYRGLGLGTRAAVAIFMHSFSGGAERGAHIGEIKRHSAVPGTPSAVVVDAVERLRNRLHYLWLQGDRYFFSTEGNLNRILVERMETLAVREKLLEDKERELLVQALKPEGTRFEESTYVWPEAEVPGNIPDAPKLALVVLRRRDERLMRQIVEQKGVTPRVNQNALVFLFPSEVERPGFRQELVRYLAYQSIQQDARRKLLRLSEQQLGEVDDALRNLEEALPGRIRMLYRLVAVPARDGLRDIDLGVPTVGDRRGIAAVVYDRLRGEQEILETVAPEVLRAKYLRDREHVETAAIFEAALRTPGEPRWASRQVVQDGIARGVREGLFGLGRLVDGRVTVTAWRTDAMPTLEKGEAIVRPDVAAAQSAMSEGTEPDGYRADGKRPADQSSGVAGGESSSRITRTATLEGALHSVHLALRVPVGGVSSLLGILNFLQGKLIRLEVEIRCSEGALSPLDWEQRVMEAIRQGRFEVLRRPGQGGA